MRRRLFGLEHTDRIRKVRVERAEHRVGRERTFDCERRHLAERMNAGSVRPAPVTRTSRPSSARSASSTTPWIDTPVACRCQPT